MAPSKASKLAKFGSKEPANRSITGTSSSSSSSSSSSPAPSLLLLLDPDFFMLPLSPLPPKHPCLVTPPSLDTTMASDIKPSSSSFDDDNAPSAAAFFSSSSLLMLPKGCSPPSGSSYTYSLNPLGCWMMLPKLTIPPPPPDEPLPSADAPTTVPPPMTPPLPLRLLWPTGWGDDNDASCKLPLPSMAPFVAEGGRLRASIMLAAMSRSFSSMSISPTMRPPIDPPQGDDGTPIPPDGSSEEPRKSESESSSITDGIIWPRRSGCITPPPSRVVPCPLPPRGMLCTDISDANTDDTKRRHRSFSGCRRRMPPIDDDPCPQSLFLSPSSSEFDLSPSPSSFGDRARAPSVPPARGGEDGTFGMGDGGDDEKKSSSSTPPVVGEAAIRLMSSCATAPSRTGDRSLRFLEWWLEQQPPSPSAEVSSLGG
mmetsp:Transcript_1150/g.2837  ORF Transcript_1150/g.2837 Transcript_1150/m.2837 type:complete len:426 (-) Transcript_1150:1009-2286(-)